jgi:hypothetical protein
VKTRGAGRKITLRAISTLFLKFRDKNKKMKSGKFW